jgi:antitoxin ParD1/3/4
MPQTTVNLPEHWHVFLREQVASGRYTSEEAVITDALRFLEERAAKIDALRAKILAAEQDIDEGRSRPLPSLSTLLHELKTSQ